MSECYDINLPLTSIKKPLADKKLLKIPSWMKSNLKGMGIEKWFPVQQIIIPKLLSDEKPHDLIISSPTGSGKTLAYAVPIILSLYRRIITRLRALIILPTKDLAEQVYKVFVRLAEGSHLKIALIGTSKYNKEKESILKDDLSFKTDLGSLIVENSLVDIIITTPGRLIEHLNDSKKFSLASIEFLIIDEADRLLQQDTMGWLPLIISKAETTNQISIRTKDDLPQLPFNIQFSHQLLTPFRKLLFSATLTDNPAKISSLKLNDPKIIYFINKCDVPNHQIEGDQKIPKYFTPESLKEFMLVCPVEKKPLFLLFLLKKFHLHPCLIFTKSVLSTENLCYYLKMHGKDLSIDFISSQKSFEERSALLEAFKKGEIESLVCTDALARGLDISNIKYVINYDVPLYMKTYIHRVGRTARAGAEGTAYTLVTSKEAKWFKDILKKSNKKQDVKKMKILYSEMEAFENQTVTS